MRPRNPCSSSSTDQSNNLQHRGRLLLPEAPPPYRVDRRAPGGFHEEARRRAQGASRLAPAGRAERDLVLPAGPDEAPRVESPQTAERDGAGHLCRRAGDRARPADELCPALSGCWGSCSFELFFGGGGGNDTAESSSSFRLATPNPAPIRLVSATARYRGSLRLNVPLPPPGRRGRELRSLCRRSLGRGSSSRTDTLTLLTDVVGENLRLGAPPPPLSDPWSSLGAGAPRRNADRRHAPPDGEGGRAVPRGCGCRGGPGPARRRGVAADVGRLRAGPRLRRRGGARGRGGAGAGPRGFL